MKYLQTQLAGMTIFLLSLSLFSCSSIYQKPKPTTDNSIKEKYWKLIALLGDTVTVNGIRETHLILKQDGERFIGHGGCNSINGKYVLKQHGSILFTNITSTDMACNAMATEQKFIRVLQSVNSYLLKGDTLILNKNRKVPLARFEAVYLQ